MAAGRLLFTFLAGALLGLGGGQTVRCAKPLDTVLVQDLLLLREKSNAVLDGLTDIVPLLYASDNSARFGIATFADKPLNGRVNGVSTTLGQANDYCLNFNQALSRKSLDKVRQRLLDLANKGGSHGGDSKQAQFEALVRSMSPRFGWSQKQRRVLHDDDDDNDRPRQRVLLLITDSIAHTSGDVARLTGLDVPANNLTFQQLAQDPNYDCASIDYPSLSTVAGHLSGVKVIVFAVDGSDDDASTIASFYSKELSSAGIDVVSQAIKSDFSNAGSHLESIISSWCGEPVTTPKPTTTTTKATTVLTTTTMTSTVPTTAGSTLPPITAAPTATVPPITAAPTPITATVPTTATVPATATAPTTVTVPTTAAPTRAASSITTQSPTVPSTVATTKTTFLESSVPNTVGSTISEVSTTLTTAVTTALPSTATTLATEACGNCNGCCGWRATVEIHLKRAARRLFGLGLFNSDTSNTMSKVV